MRTTMPYWRRVTASAWHGEVARQDAEGRRDEAASTRRGGVPGGVLEARRTASVSSGLVTSEFGDRFLGTIVIDQRFACGGRGDECGDGGVVERAWQPQTELVQPRDGVIGKQRIGTTDQGQVVAEVLRRFGQVMGAS